jgi:hypothetical protein
MKVEGEREYRWEEALAGEEKRKEIERKKERKNKREMGKYKKEINIK